MWKYVISNLFNIFLSDHDKLLDEIAIDKESNIPMSVDIYLGDIRRGHLKPGIIFTNIFSLSWWGFE